MMEIIVLRTFDCFGRVGGAPWNPFEFLEVGISLGGGGWGSSFLLSRSCSITQTTTCSMLSAWY
jgi:hypothetical protein